MLMSSWEKIEATLFQAIIDCFTLELSDIDGLGGRRRRRGRRGMRKRRRRRRRRMRRRREEEGGREGVRVSGEGIGRCS